MPTLLLSFKRLSDSRILIHGVLAPNDTAAEKELEGHARACPQFGPAFKAQQTIEQTIEIDTIPVFDEESIGEWVDEMFGLEGGEEDEDEEPGEDEEETEVEPGS